MDTGDLLDIIGRARRLLADPDRWSAHHYAEDENGRWVPVGSSRAVRFNLEGALVRSAGLRAREAMSAAAPVFRESSPGLYPRMFTTPRAMTRSEAFLLLDAAIAQLLPAGAPPSRSRGSSGLRIRTSSRAEDLTMPRSAGGSYGR